MLVKSWNLLGRDTIYCQNKILSEIYLRTTQYNMTSTNHCFCIILQLVVATGPNISTGLFFFHSLFVFHINLFSFSIKIISEKKIVFCTIMFKFYQLVQHCPKICFFLLSHFLVCFRETKKSKLTAVFDKMICNLILYDVDHHYWMSLKSINIYLIYIFLDKSQCTVYLLYPLSLLRKAESAIHLTLAY